VTTAYFLAEAGHEVTILEEKDGLGLEASAGNAGRA
jgi:glycine/D-amino acid oxidase-like deaminating enzyme